MGCPHTCTDIVDQNLRSSHPALLLSERCDELGSELGQEQPLSLPLEAMAQACCHPRLALAARSLQRCLPAQARPGRCERHSHARLRPAHAQRRLAARAENGEDGIASDDAALQSVAAAAVPAAPPVPGAVTAPQRTTLREVLAFCLPVVLVPLADPIMSLIDTICLVRGSLCPAHQLVPCGRACSSGAQPSTSDPPNAPAAGPHGHGAGAGGPGASLPAAHLQQLRPVQFERGHRVDRRRAAEAQGRCRCQPRAVGLAVPGRRGRCGMALLVACSDCL